MAVCAFLFLWAFQPFSPTVLYLYMTGEMGLSESFYGYNQALLSAAAVVAAVAYGFYCRRIRFTALIHLSIAAGVACTGAYRAGAARAAGEGARGLTCGPSQVHQQERSLPADAGRLPRHKEDSR